MCSRPVLRRGFRARLPERYCRVRRNRVFPSRVRRKATDRRSNTEFCFRVFVFVFSSSRSRVNDSPNFFGHGYVCSNIARDTWNRPVADLRERYHCLAWKPFGWLLKSHYYSDTGKCETKTNRCVSTSWEYYNTRVLWQLFPDHTHGRAE